MLHTGMLLTSAQNEQAKEPVLLLGMASLADCLHLDHSVHERLLLLTRVQHQAVLPLLSWQPHDPAQSFAAAVSKVVMPLLHYALLVVAKVYVLCLMPASWELTEVCWRQVRKLTQQLVSHSASACQLHPSDCQG